MDKLEERLRKLARQIGRDYGVGVRDDELSALKEAADEITHLREVLVETQGRSRSRGAKVDEAADEITRLKGEVEELRGKMRMIVSHATCGHSADIDESVNDICVQISSMRNLLYADGKERGGAAKQALIDELVDGIASRVELFNQEAKRIESEAEDEQYDAGRVQGLRYAAMALSSTGAFVEARSSGKAGSDA